jgi:hypothetical protein
MINQYIRVLFIFCIFLVSIFIFSNISSEYYDVKYVYNENDLKCKFSISSISEKKDNYEILIYYPITEYSKLNETINNKINDIIDNFKEDITQKDNKLTINFDHYEYEEYVSFVFNVNISSNVEHSDNYVYTLNFSTKTKNIVNIDEILKKDSSNLIKISEYIYNILSKDVDILKYSNLENIKEYLNSDKEKYNTFYFKNNAIVICFNENTIAPKVAGIFHIPIPIDKISLK